MKKEKILDLINQALNSFSEIHELVTEKQYIENQKELLLQNQNLAAEAIGALEPIFEKNIFTSKELIRAKNIFRNSLSIKDMFGSNVLLSAVSELKIAHARIKHHLSDDKNNHIENEKINKEIPNSVFIVHGHDELAKTETARFIEKLGLEAIILHEKANSGKTIIEKIEEHTNVGFGIVLYTPCDYGSTINNENLKPRARQNVVFEHGYLIGKIGRNNVCALVKGNIEIPNDISGVVYIQYEKEWRLSLAKELRNSGYLIDMNLVI